MASILQAQLSVDVHREERAAIVAPSGEVDLASAPSLEAGLGRVWQSGAEHVILDLRGVQFMDSTGLHVILSAHEHAQQVGLRFEVVDGGEQVHKLLTLTGVLNKLNLAAEPAELLHSSSRI